MIYPLLVCIGIYAERSRIAIFIERSDSEAKSGKRFSTEHYLSS